MTRKEVDEAYKTITRIVKNYEDNNFKIGVVQDKANALVKIAGTAGAMAFDRCYSGLLGNLVVDPSGIAHLCCQYFDKTLPPVGDTNTNSLTEIWNGVTRLKVLQMSPRNICNQCSPSDEYINRTVQFIIDAYRINKESLGAFKKIVFSRRNLENRGRHFDLPESA